MKVGGPPILRCISCDPSSVAVRIFAHALTDACLPLVLPSRGVLFAVVCFVSLPVQVLDEAHSFLGKFDSCDELQTTMGDALQGPREAKLLYMESLLLRQFQVVEAGNSSQDAARDMKSLVNRQRIFLTSNHLNITASDLHAGLWRAAQEFGQGQGEV